MSYEYTAQGPNGNLGLSILATAPFRFGVQYQAASGWTWIRENSFTLDKTNQFMYNARIVSEASMDMLINVIVKLCNVDLL